MRAKKSYCRCKNNHSFSATWWSCSMTEKQQKNYNTWKPFIWIYKEVTTLWRQLYIWPEMLITTFLSLNKMLSFWFSLFFLLPTKFKSWEDNYYIQNSLDSYTQHIRNGTTDKTTIKTWAALLWGWGTDGLFRYTYESTHSWVFKDATCVTLSLLTNMGKHGTMTNTFCW